MNFHTDVTTFYPCGEDQTVAWSEHANYEQAALASDWAAADPIAVSADLLRHMNSYSTFAVAKPRLGVYRYFRRLAWR
jgi:hypothetical protein